MEKKPKKNKWKIFSILGILLIVSSSLIIANSNKPCEKRIEFYYNPSCPHCQEVIPLINKYQEQYNKWEFYIYDVTKGSYPNISGVPTIKIYPEKGREIILTGSYEIPKYLKCELEEKSSLECPTHLNLIRGSYFLE